MENFVVSARKYRPATFATVVGQHAITSTLKNAIKNNHLAQAFLFCGPRGVGKTTCARILAKTINCQELRPDFEACDQCPSCISFNQSATFNVFELDAASNNSVDDIRSLVDQVRIPPQAGKYKVYIIDEVHMLSTQAFNAFLKTLEEPPAYAKFILATTEKHKIIPTILSRCQIFDFKRIIIDDIAQHLAYVAKQESISAEPDALHIIAQKADGALRDALSIFDQIVSFSGSNITYKDVIENLNVLDYDYYFRITDNLCQGNSTHLLLLLNEIVDKGFDPHHFITGLAEHFRNLLVCRHPETVKLLEVGESTRERYKVQAQSCQDTLLIKCLEITSSCDINYRISNNKRLSVELALLQMCSITQQGDEKKKDEPFLSLPTPAPKTPAQATSSAPITQTPIAPSNPTPSAIPTAIEAPPASSSVVAPPPPSPPNEPPKIASSFSIKNSLQGKKEVTLEETIQEIIPPAPVMNTPFTQEELEHAWTTYANERAITFPSYYSLLLMDKPHLAENYKVYCHAQSDGQAEELRARKGDLVDFLRHTLKNNQLVVETKIVEIQVEKKAYSSTEKFQKMTEKNPHLMSFKDELGLEIDY